MCVCGEGASSVLCLKVFELIQVLLKKALESHELPGCAALTVATGSTGDSWVFPVLLTELALPSETCVGLLAGMK